MKRRGSFCFQEEIHTKILLKPLSMLLIISISIKVDLIYSSPIAKPTSVLRDGMEFSMI